MDERATDGTDPARPIAAAMSACDVFIARPAARSATRRRASGASEAGARGATLPGVTEDMLARVMAVDFDRMAARSRAVAELLTAAGQAQVTCPRGTDFTLELTGREGLADDGAADRAGRVRQPARRRGLHRPARRRGHDRRLQPRPARPQRGARAPDGRRRPHRRPPTGGLGPEYLELLRAHGELGTNLAELGIGTNDRAILTGNVLEDEKILGTVHIAFGASAGIGGTVSVPIHLDVVVLEASLTDRGHDRARVRPLPSTEPPARP